MQPEETLRQEWLRPHTVLCPPLKSDRKVHHYLYILSLIMLHHLDQLQLHFRAYCMKSKHQPLLSLRLIMHDVIIAFLFSTMADLRGTSM